MKSKSFYALELELEHFFFLNFGSTIELIL